jgi:phosphate transport system substrate-binding protein
MKARKSLAVIVTAASALILSALPAYAENLNGSGATFAQPLIDACKGDFTRETGHTLNYPGGGSSKGRTDFAARLVDFAGSDAPYTSGAPAANEFVYAPIYAAPIAVMYNLPTVKDSIYLSPSTIAQIFSGSIKNWDDKLIAADNERKVKTPVYKTKNVTTKVNGKKVTRSVPALDKNGQAIVSSYIEKTVNIDLPKEPITVWYRTDGSGTSENFTLFLRDANAGANQSLWSKAPSQTFSSSTPTSISGFFNFQGASGSAAVAAGVASKVGSISYSELSFATDNKLGVANVKNAAGEFVAPSASGTSIFLGGGTINDDGTVTVDFKKSIPGAYSLGTASYGLAYTGGRPTVKQAAVSAWFTYVLEQCPTKYPAKGFALITGPIAEKAKLQIAKIK